VRQSFLREPAGLSQASHVLANDLLPAHARMNGVACRLVEEL
jgi:hypothetical protein